MSKQELLDYVKLLEEELEEERRLRTQEAHDYESLENEYERIIREKDQELIKAKGKIISQEITLASYKDKVGVPLIVEGQERDLYKGEQKDFIISLITATMQNFGKTTRTRAICESLLEANRATGNREHVQQTIANTLRNYAGMTNSVISELNSVGLDVEKDGKNHYAIRFNGDNRYTYNIAATPSDPRCGVNSIADINKLFF